VYDNNIALIEKLKFPSSSDRDNKDQGQWIDTVEATTVLPAIDYYSHIAQVCYIRAMTSRTRSTTGTTSSYTERDVTETMADQSDTFREQQTPHEVEVSKCSTVVVI
jgi:hypothetical protein